MKTYQTLSLIGNIFGILITIGLFMMGSFVLNLGENLRASDPNFPISPETAENEASIAGSIAGFAFAFLLYIAMLITTFVVKDKPNHVKALGVTLLVVGFMAVLMTLGWGIIPYALLIPAGILAIREPKKHRYYGDTIEV